MRPGARSSRPFVVASLLALSLLATAAAAAATPSPQQVYRSLLKRPAAASLPAALKGSSTKVAKVDAASRSHHAVGAVEVGTSEARVGFVVFPTHALALTDLEALRLDQGPNTVVTKTLAGFPAPAYLIRAAGNGYESAYVIFVLGNVLVTSWTFGPAGATDQIAAVAEQDGHWAKSLSLRITRAA